MNKKYVVEVERIGRDTMKRVYFFGEDETAYVIEGAQQFDSRIEVWQQVLKHMECNVATAYSRIYAIYVKEYDKGYLY